LVLLVAENPESYCLFGNFEFVEDHCFLFWYILRIEKRKREGTPSALMEG
jgi:hypothetical protein